MAEGSSAGSMSLSLVHVAISIAALILVLALLAVLKAHAIDPVGKIASWFMAPPSTPTGSP